MIPREHLFSVSVPRIFVVSNIPTQNRVIATRESPANCHHGIAKNDPFACCATVCLFDVKITMYSAGLWRITTIARIVWRRCNTQIPTVPAHHPRHRRRVGAIAAYQFVLILYDRLELMPATTLHANFSKLGNCGIMATWQRTDASSAKQTAGNIDFAKRAIVPLLRRAVSAVSQWRH
jgi:hypothetical protein